MDLVSELHAAEKKTILLVSHSMEDVAEYVERIMVMNSGSILYDGTPREVFAHFRELEEIGLAAPQMTYIMQYLKEKGIDVRTDLLTVKEAAAEILRAYGFRQ
jgi:energy-coupling factor transport system ATP-binding protein